MLGRTGIRGAVWCVLIGVAVVTNSAANADNPGAIAGVHGRGDGFFSLSLGLAPQVFPRYEGADEARFFLFPLVDLSMGRPTDPWFVYVGASRNEVPLGQGLGVFPIHTPDWNLSVEIARTESRPEGRGPALAGMGDRRANWFASARLSRRFLAGSGQADLVLARGLLDDAGMLALLRVQMSRRTGPWVVAAAVKATVSDARNLAYEFGISNEQAQARSRLLSAGDPRLEADEAGPYSPGGGVRSAELTVSAGRGLGKKLRAFAYARGGRLLGNAADSPLARSKSTYLVGVGVTAVVF